MLSCGQRGAALSIERQFDVSLIAGMALREKQIQQSYRPIIGVHKWFARRPGTLFRGLVLAEFGRGRLEDRFFRANDFPGMRIADPFMGGGTPLIEANRVGCDVEGFDINPMSAWIVREEIEPIDLAAYEQAAGALIDTLHTEIGGYYRTSCPHYGDPDVPVKSFLWVKAPRLRSLRGVRRSVSRLPAGGEPPPPEERPGVPGVRRSERGRGSQSARKLLVLRERASAGRTCRPRTLRVPALRTRQRLSRRRRPPRSGTACSPSSTTTRTANGSTRGASSRSPTPTTWPARTKPLVDGRSSRLASCPTSSFRRATRPIGCTVGGTRDTGRCSIHASSSVWS